MKTADNAIKNYNVHVHCSHNKQTVQQMAIIRNSVSTINKILRGIYQFYANPCFNGGSNEQQIRTCSGSVQKFNQLPSGPQSTYPTNFITNRRTNERVSKHYLRQSMAKVLNTAAM